MHFVGKVGSSEFDKLEILRHSHSVLDRGFDIWWVVSARKDRTDELIEEAENLELTGQDYVRHIIQGEYDSARFLTEFFNDNGLDAKCYVQEDEVFPVVCNDPTVDANPVDEFSVLKGTLYVYPLNVVAGFGGRTIDGKIGLFGRGGTDVVAAQLAKGINCISGEDVELVYFKGTGIHSREGVLYSRITVSELRRLIIQEKRRVLTPKTLDILDGNCCDGVEVYVGSFQNPYNTKIVLDDDCL